MSCPVCGKEFGGEEYIFIWDDLEKQSVRICGSSKCIQAFKCELRRRHRHKNVLSKEILS